MNVKNEYQGYLETLHLFNVSNSLPFNIFNEALVATEELSIKIKPGLRLGNRVEHYVMNHLIANDYKVIANSIQVISNGITLGELDCILSKNNIVTHLEIVCKFYLYDSSVGKTELNHWIGPNRKDCLMEKVNKLQNKQLPLLHNIHTKSTLHKLGIDKIDNQKVFFVAQLFVPYNSEALFFNKINAKCIAGTYISLENIENLIDYDFYIPSKEEWLQNPTRNVNWEKLDAIIVNLRAMANMKKSPLCWIKDSENEIKKTFITWW